MVITTSPLNVLTLRWLSCFVAASLPLLPSTNPIDLAQAVSGLATLELPPGQVKADAVEMMLLSVILCQAYPLWRYPQAR